jgi:methionyl aminopeptidase
MVKTPAEIALMREGGRHLSKILKQLLAEVKEGAVPLEIDHRAKKLIAETGGSPSFLTVNDYQYATCISVNDGVVHGIPTTTPFKAGDIVSVDIGLLYKGYHTDTSWSVYLPPVKQTPETKAIGVFMEVGKQALEKAIAAARVGNHIGHISQAIGDTVEGHGYSIVRSLVGHGVGTSLHESPQVPGVLTKPIEKTPVLKVGMVLAIEVIYAMGGPEVVYANHDGWSLATADGSLASLYEQTIAIDEEGPIILTRS